MKLVVWDKSRSRAKLRVWGDFVVRFEPENHFLAAMRQGSDTPLYSSDKVEYAGEAEPGVVEVVEK